MNAVDLTPASHRKNFSRWVWGFYTALVLWALAFSALSAFFIGGREKRMSDLSAEKLLRHYALSFSDAIATEDAALRRALLSRLSGEEDSLYAELAAEGGLVDSSGKRPEGATEKGFSEWTVPISVQGKRWGVLRWDARTGGGWAGQKYFWRIFSAWAWFAVLGFAGTLIFWKWTSDRMAD
jgi:hypothetical protein